MARIAHLSDLHLLEPAVRARKGRAWWRVQYLSLKRSIDYVSRRARAEVALRTVQTQGFDHLVITGDLTEDGSPDQYEVLAEVLATSGIDAERITLCPGNHDAYGLAWEAACAGPLRPWAKPAAWLDDCVIVPVSSAIPQTVLRSAGRIERAALLDVEALAVREPGRAVLLAQHHPPYALLHQWIHGLLNYTEVIGLLQARPNLSVLHGHTHKHRDGPVVRGGPARVFSPTAVTEHSDPVRLYDVVDGQLIPVPGTALMHTSVATMMSAMGEVVLRDVEALGDALGDAVLGDVEAIGEAVEGEVRTLGGTLQEHESEHAATDR